MMINLYKGQKEHPGEQPIRVLWEAIPYYFQNYHPDIIKNHEELKRKGHLTPNINVYVEELPIFSKECTLLPTIEYGTINLPEIYLTYLWCVCFFIHTPYYETIHKKNVFENNIVLVTECYELMAFARQIKTQYEILDKTKRFNPEYFDEINAEVIGNTNGVFINAVSFILCHEYVHAKYRLYGNTKEDEAKTDAIAVKMLKEGAKDKNDFGNRAIGALIGLGSLLLLTENVNIDHHPDNDKRLLDFIENLELNDDNNEIWALGCFILAYWDNEYSVKLDFLFDDLTISYKERFVNLVEQK